jgi:hypothetical protein
MNFLDEELSALEMPHFVQHDKLRSLPGSTRLEEFLLAANFQLGRLRELLILETFFQILTDKASTAVKQRGSSSIPNASPLFIID